MNYLDFDRPTGKLNKKIEIWRLKENARMDWAEIQKKAPGKNIYVTREVYDEFASDPDGLKIIFYYEEPETNAEYEKRLDDFERAKATETIRLICSYQGHLAEKESVKILVDRVIAKFPRFMADWQRDHYNNFLRQNSVVKMVADARQKGYDEGYAKATLEIEELKKTLSKFKLI